MLDNLRDDASTSFYEEDTIPPQEDLSAAIPPRRRNGGKFLGMTPVQRFIIATMLMIVVCVLGTMCLLLTNRIGLIV